MVTFAPSSLSFLTSNHSCDSSIHCASTFRFYKSSSLRHRCVPQALLKIWEGEGALYHNSAQNKHEY